MVIRSYFSLERTWENIWDVLRHNWHLGFTSFGGPPVHFKIYHDKFVTELGWVDEQIYQELFAICQAFSGPASTKMHFCLNLMHDGFLAAVLAFLIWSLPGALGMYGLSIGVSHIGDSLPRAVYALLSGLNAAVVGIIALAAVQLAQKAITDKVTRILVFLGGTAGLLYNALWYLPLLMLLAGCTTLVSDYRVLHGPLKWITGLVRKQREMGTETEEGAEIGALPQDNAGTAVGGRYEDVTTSTSPSQVREGDSLGSTRVSATQRIQSDLPISNTEFAREENMARVVPTDRMLSMSWKQGTIAISLFFLTFIVIMVLRGTLTNPSLLYSLFANMYLAGTIIFGGGPVVIPLLREYVVVEGWVSPRDFLLGLAIIQAFPGPNFNIAVYLGSLTAIGGGYASVWGAVLGFLGIMVPGMWTVYGEMGLWSALRGKRWLKSVLRGINSAAVGLIFTAIYRLWQIGYIDKEFEAGISLGNDPWWLVITATSYTGGQWFGLSPPLAIVLGAIMGLVRYGVVSR